MFIFQPAKNMKAFFPFGKERVFAGKPLMGFPVSSINKISKRSFEISHSLSERHFRQAGKMFIFNLTYIKPIEKVEELLPAHIRFLDAYYEKGKILCSGRKNPRTGGVILCRCESLAEAEAIRDQDPFYWEGAADYEIIEFLPTKMSQGFRALLE